MTDLRAHNTGAHMVLTWRLPADRDMRGVWVVRTLAADGCATTLHGGMQIGTRLVRSRAVDNTAVPRTRYCYTVFVTDTAGHRSSADDTGPVAMPDRTPPAPVAHVTADVSGSDVVVSWSPAKGASHYLVMRGAADACPTAPRRRSAIAKTTGLRFTDTSAKPGGGYCYAVFAVDAAGNPQTTPSTAPPITLSRASTPKVAKPGGPTHHVVTPSRASAGSGSGPLASEVARIVAAIAVAVVVFGGIVLAGLRLQNRRRTAVYGPSRSRGGAARLQLSDYDTRALVIPAALGVAGLLLVLALAALLL
ncbi:MAG: hypothetical protein ACTHNU_13745 [Gaiellales bacterium]